MTGTLSRRRGLIAVLLVLVVALPAQPVHAIEPAEEAVAAGQAFLDRYVTDDGRVVRRDQGGDTVSEGQAYALLVAVAVEDRARFDDIWAWTAANLQRPDGLLAWRWADGQVADFSPATDADLAAASALALAAARFSDGRYLGEARRIAASILDRETVAVGSMQVLVAGPWAVPTRTVNVSYFMINAMSRLVWATGDQAWSAVASSSRELIDDLTGAPPHLPPDWSTIGADGQVTATSAPNGRSSRFGYEAGRAVVQLAVDCRQDGRALAARAWPYFESHGAEVTAEATLDGRPIGTDRHPLALVAAAASAQAAGHDDASDRLLDEATALDRAYPTYYGAAWVALARLWLDTPRLGGCRTA